jgi:hypothetical protein
VHNDTPFVPPYIIMSFERNICSKIFVDILCAVRPVTALSEH